jgi:tetratricopeptide (TPR) repeat protein
MVKNSLKAKHKKGSDTKEFEKKATNKSDKTTSKTNNKIWIAIAALIITFVTFYPSLHLQFVNWDDPQNLLENKNLAIFSYQWDWATIKTIFSTDVMGNYNPLPIFTFAIEKYFFAPNPELNPFVFHFNNLWMHLVCTALVFVIFIKLEMSLAAAFIGALLFGIHPMRVESVAWITERKDVLYGMFFLASLFTYILYLRSEASKTRWYLLTLLLSVFAYFAKVQAVTLPLSMLLIDFIYKRKWSSLKVLIIEKLPWWILSLVFGLVNVFFLKNNKSFEVNTDLVQYSIIDRLAIGAYSYVVYLIKWIYPYQMSPLYPYPKHLPTIAYACLFIVPILIIASGIWFWKKQKSSMIFGWTFFTFNVMFLLQIVGAGQGFLADRFTYIAYIGLFYISVKVYENALNQYREKSSLINIFVGLYLLILSMMTYKQIDVWRNGETLWEHVKSEHPKSPLAWKQAGFYYRDKKKDFAKAIENYNEAVRLDPKDNYVYNGLAKAYLDYAFTLNPNTPKYAQKRKELFEQAITNYELALKGDSLSGRRDKKTTGEITVNRGVAFAATGNTEKAIVELSKGLEINPDNENGYLNRGLLYFQTEQFELSIKDHESYLRLNPFNADVYHENGLAKRALGRFEESLKDFDKAITLKSSQPLFHVSKAETLFYLGRKDEARKNAQIAKQMGVAVPEILLK